MRSFILFRVSVLTICQDSVDRTNEEIKARVDSNLATLSENFRTRLDDIQQHSLNSYQSTEAKEIIITRPTDETILEWESVDKLRLGKTKLKSRIRKLEKILNVEEASIGREMEQLRRVNVDLDHLMNEISGTDDEENSTLTNPDVCVRNPQHQTPSRPDGVQLDLEVEESGWLYAIGTTNKVAMNRMTESVKVVSSAILQVVML